MLLLFGCIIAICIIIFLAKNSSVFEPPEKKAGRRGEKYAAKLISEVLKPEDTLLNGVEVSLHGKRAEFDELVINSRGVFIIEVKNWSGKLFGDAEDDTWQKIKTTSGGNHYEKEMENPIRQMKREVYILANYLKEHNIKVWVEGYVYFVNGNCPVHNDQVLESKEDINQVIHWGRNNRLSRKQVDAIVSLLR